MINYQKTLKKNGKFDRFYEEIGRIDFALCDDFVKDYFDSINPIEYESTEDLPITIKFTFSSYRPHRKGWKMIKTRKVNGDFQFTFGKHAYAPLIVQEELMEQNKLRIGWVKIEIL